MDQLFNAACTGDLNILHKLLEENPFVLTDYILINHKQNPLNIAIKANQQLFVREILRLQPELALELDQDGNRPLDVASAYGKLEILGEIIEAVGPENICRLAGRDGKTAIHYAAMNGKAEILDKLVSACSDSVKDVTIYGESVLHVAVKGFKFEALRSLLQWLEKVEMEEMVNWEDAEGNTVMHLAVLRKQVESIHLLLDWNKTSRNKLQLNAVNKKGLTPLDIVDILIESSNDIHLGDILRRAGASASASSESQFISNTPTDTNPPAEKPKNWSDILKHFEFHWHRDSPGEARATLLLIAALIATVTFQAGIDPPSYIFEDSNGTNTTITNQSQNVSSSNVTQKNDAETRNIVAILAFLVANTISLSTAMTIIDYLTVGLPFQRELRVSMGMMMFAYGISIGTTKPTGTLKTVLLLVAISIPILLRAKQFLEGKFRKTRRRNG